MNVASKMATKLRAAARRTSETGPIYHDQDSEPPNSGSDEEAGFSSDEDTRQSTSKRLWTIQVSGVYNYSYRRVQIGIGKPARF